MSSDDYKLRETPESKDNTWPKPADVLYVLLALRLCDKPEQRTPIGRDLARWDIESIPTANYHITSTSTGKDFSAVHDEKPLGHMLKQNDGEI